MFKKIYGGSNQESYQERKDRRKHQQESLFNEGNNQGYKYFNTNYGSDQTLWSADINNKFSEFLNYMQNWGFFRMWDPYLSYNENRNLGVEARINDEHSDPYIKERDPNYMMFIANHGENYADLWQGEDEYEASDQLARSRWREERRSHYISAIPTNIAPVNVTRSNISSSDGRATLNHEEHEVPSFVENVKAEKVNLILNRYTCQICMSNEISCVLFPCSHSFCLTCINTHKKKNNNCPICKKHIDMVVPINLGDVDNNAKNKYLKYKNKYLILKKKLGSK